MEQKLVDLMVELKKGYIEDEKQIRTLCSVSSAKYKGVIEITTTKKVVCNILSKKMNLSVSRGSRMTDSLVRYNIFNVWNY